MKKCHYSYDSKRKAGRQARTEGEKEKKRGGEREGEEREKRELSPNSLRPI